MIGTNHVLQVRTVVFGLLRSGSTLGIRSDVPLRIHRDQLSHTGGDTQPAAPAVRHRPDRWAATLRWMSSARGHLDTSLFPVPEPMRLKLFLFCLLLDFDTDIWLAMHGEAATMQYFLAWTKQRIVSDQECGGRFICGSFKEWSITCLLYTSRCV